jgi:hypothetical protein
MKAQNGTTTCKETPSEPSKNGEGEACLPKFGQTMINLDPTATCGWNNDTMLLNVLGEFLCSFFF